jgi:hypothetical protein
MNALHAAFGAIPALPISSAQGQLSQGNGRRAEAEKATT